MSTRLTQRTSYREMMSNSSRLRAVYATIAGLTIFVGLLIHSHPDYLSAIVRDRVGDALWASMMASIISALIPTQHSFTRSGVALVICYAVEFSQLLHQPPLDKLRATELGALTLGTGF
ncbi:MAG: DUF2809 domain-containing protein, partial [Gemmatimonadaceae bacterium]